MFLDCSCAGLAEETTAVNGAFVGTKFAFSGASRYWCPMCFRTLCLLLKVEKERLSNGHRKTFEFPSDKIASDCSSGRHRANAEFLLSSGFNQSQLPTQIVKTFFIPKHFFHPSQQIAVLSSTTGI